MLPGHAGCLRDLRRMHKHSMLCLDHAMVVLCYAPTVEAGAAVLRP